MVDDKQHQQQEKQDLMLPVAIVGRIMKKVLPENAKISKEAKERMQESATEFISFVTAEASDKCHKENRKTVNGDDICWALTSLGFDNYADAILRYLHRFRQAESEKANKQIKPMTSSTSTSNPNLNKDESFNPISTAPKSDSKNPTQLEFRVLEKGSTSSLS